MRILLLGAPGTGKSTVGKRLAVDMGWFWLSSGELLRESQEQWVIDKLKTAELFDDDMMAGLVIPRVIAAENLILDGFPRTLKQAKILVDRQVKLDMIMELVIPLEEALTRLEARGRDQDTPEIVRERWAIYEREKTEMMAFLAGNGVKIATVDGVGTMDEVYARALAEVKKLNK